MCLLPGEQNATAPLLLLSADALGDEWSSGLTLTESRQFLGTQIQRWRGPRGEELVSSQRNGFLIFSRLQALVEDALRSTQHSSVAFRYFDPQQLPSPQASNTWLAYLRAQGITLRSPGDTIFSFGFRQKWPADKHLNWQQCPAFLASWYAIPWASPPDWAGNDLLVARSPTATYWQFEVRNSSVLRKRIEEWSYQQGTLRDIEYGPYRIRELLYAELMPDAVAYGLQLPANPCLTLLNDTTLLVADSHLALQRWLDYQLSGSVLGQQSSLLLAAEQAPLRGFVRRDTLWEGLPLLSLSSAHASGLVLQQKESGIRMRAVATDWAPTAVLQWRLSLPVASRLLPQRSAADYIFVQTADQELRAYDGFGVLRWSRPLSGPLRGAPRAVRLESGQRLFIATTDRQVLCMDTLGDNYGRFPIDLPAKAVQPLQSCYLPSLASHRIVVLGQDQRLYAYDLGQGARPDWPFGQFQVSDYYLYGTEGLLLRRKEGWQHRDWGGALIASLDLPAEPLTFLAKWHLLVLEDGSYVYRSGDSWRGGRWSTDQVTLHASNEEYLLLGGPGGRYRVQLAERRGERIGGACSDLSLVPKTGAAHAYASGGSWYLNAEGIRAELLPSGNAVQWLDQQTLVIRSSDGLQAFGIRTY